MSKTIAFFDFDGTITRKDTMLELIKFSKGNAAYYRGMLMISPWLASMKAGLLSRTKAKEKLLSAFFKGVHIDEFNALCKSFTEQVIPSLIRKDASAEIEKHKKDNSEIVVVTASAENWVKGWCDANNLKLLATRLHLDEKNCLTGKLDGINCNGIEKVNRIKLSYDPAAYENIFCYGDSSGDRDMLAIATHPHYRYFKL